MNIDAAMAAVEVLMDHSAEFELAWGELDMDTRLTIMTDMQIAIEQEVY